MAAGKSVSSLQATDSPVTIPAITRLPFMPIRHAIWTVGQTPQELRLSRLPSEQVLEEMITATPSILSEEWMLIGRQERTSYDGRIDLIAIAPDGSLILIEIKRDRTPREVAAQALDYASWIEQLEPEDIGRIYERFSKGRNLKEDFEKRFGHSIPDEELNQSHQIIIVAAELDQSTERIVRYLNDRDIPINVLFFQVFEHGSQQLLSRAWIIDPVETQVHAAETATPSKDKEPWNGEYYANFGHSSTRPWDEARQYGFISGGGGKFYSGTLKLLREGDRVWVRVPGEGFVGVGIVKGPMQHALDFQVETPDGPRPAMDVLTGGTYHREYLNDPERSEYFVPIEWIKTVPLSQAVNEAGMFGNQNTVCRPKTRQWSYTIDLLKRAFDIT
jgi:hypothetical protein